MKQNNYLGWIFILVSVLLINWIYGQKATFIYLLMILTGMLVYRYDDIRELINKKEKQSIYYPNLNLQK